MKLSELIALRDRLRLIDIETQRIKEMELINTFRELLDDAPPVDPVLIQTLESTALSKQEAVGSLHGYLESYIDRSIKDHYPAYYAQSDVWTQHIDMYDYTQWTEYCHSIYNTDADELIEFSSTRITNLSSWTMPALVFNVDNIQHLNEMFGFYPIYIVDKWREIVPNLEETYHQAQIRKVRVYDLDKIRDFPMRAMGMAMSRNHFTHCSRAQFITEIEWLVKAIVPGGHIVFNFNDCEHSKCAALFEKSIRSFMLGTDVREILNSLGLTITAWDYLEDSGTVWVEAKLPGQFKSKKRSEPLGIIQSK